MAELLAVVTIIASFNYNCLAAGVAAGQHDDNLSSFETENERNRNPNKKQSTAIVGTAK